VQDLVQACAEHLQGGISPWPRTQHLATLTAQTFISTFSNEHSLLCFPLLTHGLTRLSQRLPGVLLITTPGSMTAGQPLETGPLLSHLLAQGGTFSAMGSPPAQESCWAGQKQGQLCLCFSSTETTSLRATDSWCRAENQMRFSRSAAEDVMGLEEIGNWTSTALQYHLGKPPALICRAL